MKASLGDRAVYASLRGAIGTLGALRWDNATGIGAHLGALGYRPFGIRRAVVESQIAASLPEVDFVERQRIARACYEHLGRLAVETALLPSLGPEKVIELMEHVDGWDVVERAMARGHGLVFVTGHLGNWELGGAYIVSRGIPLDVVARRMNNPLFDRYLTSTRDQLGMSVVYDRDAVRRTARAVREGRAVAFLVDQAGLNLASTWVPFFGRLAKTPRGPAVFALRWDMPVVFGTALRQPNGRYRLSFEEIPVSATGDRDRDIDETVERYTATLERWVRRAPEQYFWHHRRWKHQPDAVRDAAADPA